MMVTLVFLQLFPLRVEAEVALIQTEMVTQEDRQAEVVQDLVVLAPALRVMYQQSLHHRVGREVAVQVQERGVEAAAEAVMPQAYSGHTPGVLVGMEVQEVKII
jgi:hypothetical protein